MEQNQKGSKAYLISIVMVAVLGGLLFGYDTAVISGAEKGLQAFFKGANDFEYSDFMHGFTSSSALIGCIIGSSLSGLFASNFGRKRSLIFAGICFFLSAWGSMEPESYILPQGQADWSLLVVFNFYRVLGGIGVGMASAICPMYIGEIAPSNVRGMLVSWNQFAIIFGQLVVYFVNFLIMGSHANPIYDAAGAIANMVDPDEWIVPEGVQRLDHGRPQDGIPVVHRMIDAIVFHSHKAIPEEVPEIELGADALSIPRIPLFHFVSQFHQAMIRIHVPCTKAKRFCLIDQFSFHDGIPESILPSLRHPHLFCHHAIRCIMDQLRIDHGGRQVLFVADHDMSACRT